MTYQPVPHRCVKCRLTWLFAGETCQVCATSPAETAGRKKPNTCSQCGGPSYEARCLKCFRAAPTPNVQKFLDADFQPGECWNWPGTRAYGGYGVLSQNGKQVKAHRWVYELLVGPIPEGLVIDHLCRNPSCVNPDHLEAVTSAENVKRSPIAPAVVNAAKTHCKHGHEFTPENTKHRPTGGRSCVTCRRESDRRARARKAAAKLERAVIPSTSPIKGTLGGGSIAGLARPCPGCRRHELRPGEECPTCRENPFLRDDNDSTERRAA